MKFKRYLLLAISFFSIHLYSQNATLTGKITEESGDALIGANAVIDASKGYGGVADDNGNYEISVPAGTYDVLFKYLGKDDQTKKITLAAGETKTLNIKMLEKQNMINVIVVSGSKYEKPLSEETVSMDVLKGTSLQSQNITDLASGMTRVPGVTIADGQVNIRGGAGWSYGAGSRVLVLIDDLPLMSADAADAKWSIIPMENVEQVEVIKGAASALYGSGALNGIINVRTAYATTESYTKATIYTGIFQKPTITPGMAWWGSNSPLSGGVNFAHRQKFGQNDLVIGFAYDATTGYLDSSDNHAIRGNVKYRHRFKKVEGLSMGINLSAYYSYGKTFFFWNGLDSNGYKPFAGTITEYKSYRFTIDPFIEYFDKKNNHFKFNGRFFNSTNTNNTGQGSVPNLYYAELQYQRKIDFKKFDFNVVTGLVNSYGDVNPPRGSTNSLFGKNNSYNFSAYAQTDFKFFKKLNVTLGARWEYFQMRHYETDSTAPGEYFQRLDTVQNSLSQLKYPLFRAGLNYQAAEFTFIRASFGQGFRYPTIAERYISTSVGPITIASNPNLNPEKGYSAEIALKQGFALDKARNWKGYADASFFWNQYEDMMEFSFGQYGPQSDWSKLNKTFGLGFSSQNIGRTRILGTELIFAVDGKIKDFGIQMLAGYNFIDPRALGWNDTLKLYNFEGVQVENGYMGNPNAIASRTAYNNPDKLNYMTYAQTSSSATNLLKYRSRHTFKYDLTLSYKGLEINTNLQYSSYQENVDYAFVSPLITNFFPGAFGGLKQYREQKEVIKIGNGKGDIVWNAHIAYNFKQGVRVAFLVRNLLNWEYTPRPAFFEAPRNYTLQLSYTFRGLDKNKN